MPVYQWRCPACGATLEEIQPMGAPAPRPCPECGGDLRRAYGRVGVRFSGWGFRRTDSLVPEGRPRKDFQQLRRKAEEISEA